ncbi:MAG: hypothetical protein ABIX28_22605 [Vicinamibacterales bacterium]
MRTRIVPLLSTVVFSLTLLAGSADAAPRRVYVRVGPPAPIVEVRHASPGPRYVWVDGYQRWNGRAYAWAPGRWVVPPRGRKTWVPARWVHDRHGYYVVQGHWR